MEILVWGHVFLNQGIAKVIFKLVYRKKLGFQGFVVVIAINN